MQNFIENSLLPYMTRKTVNKNHTAYGIKDIVERQTHKYISLQDFQDYLAKRGFPANDFYPVSEKFFRRFS